MLNSVAPPDFRPTLESIQEAMGGEIADDRVIVDGPDGTPLQVWPQAGTRYGFGVHWPSKAGERGTYEQARLFVGESLGCKIKSTTEPLLAAPPTLGDLAGLYGGRIESGWLRDAEICGQPVTVYIGSGQIVVDRTTGPYTAQQLGAFLHMELGVALPPYAANAVAPPVAANDNKPIKATQFVLRDPSLIPPREWLYGRHYARKYLTATFGAGGGGKSANAVTELLSMVTGLPLLGGERAAPLSSPLWCLPCSLQLRMVAPSTPRVTRPPCSL